MMTKYTVTLSLSAARSRILVTTGTDEIMRAVLPATDQVQHPRAALRLLEGLALWLDQAPRVVVSADESDATSFFNLTDEFGCAQHGLYHTVEVVERRARPRRGKRITRVGDFRDLRQLSLIGGGTR
jgi:hypothetical protein